MKEQQASDYHGAINPFCILGLTPDATPEEVDLAYTYLSKAFEEDSFMDTPQSWYQAEQARMSIESAYQSIKNNEAADYECQDEPIPLKLGQLLVATGIITYDELEEAIRQQKEINLPVGEILKRSSLITQLELEKFLLTQKNIRLPMDSPYRFGQRLLGMGLVPEDMIHIALLERRAVNLPLGEILVQKNWLSPRIFAVLTNEPRIVDANIFASNQSAGTNRQIA